MIRNIKLTVPKILAPKYRLLAGNPFNFFKTQRTAKKDRVCNFSIIYCSSPVPNTTSRMTARMVRVRNTMTNTLSLGPKAKDNNYPPKTILSLTYLISLVQ